MIHRMSELLDETSVIINNNKSTDVDYDSIFSLCDKFIKNNNITEKDVIVPSADIVLSTVATMYIKFTTGCSIDISGLYSQIFINLYSQMSIPINYSIKDLVEHIKFLPCLFKTFGIVPVTRVVETSSVKLISNVIFTSPDNLDNIHSEQLDISKLCLMDTPTWPQEKFKELMLFFLEKINKLLTPHNFIMWKSSSGEVYCGIVTSYIITGNCVSVIEINNKITTIPSNVNKEIYQNVEFIDRSIFSKEVTYIIKNLQEKGVYINLKDTLAISVFKKTIPYILPAVIGDHAAINHPLFNHCHPHNRYSVIKDSKLLESIFNERSDNYTKGLAEAIIRKDIYNFFGFTERKFSLLPQNLKGVIL